MDKKVILLMLLASFSLVSATCSLDVTLVNQDPYPAMPGEYTKVIFQVTGLQSPDCGTVKFWVNEDFPFSLDPESQREFTMISGTYVKDYSTFFLAPYKLRVSEDAIEGDNDLEISYSFQEGNQERIYKEKFAINVEDSRSDFEVHVKDYDPITKKVTFEILNIGESNVDALTVEIPKQDNVNLRGSNRVIVGTLDANEEDSFLFDGELKEGTINLIVSYTDQIAKRRVLEKTVNFDPSYFSYKIVKDSSVSPVLIFVIGFLIPVVFMWIRGKIRKNKERRKRELIKK
jgi:hypothetical protein